MSDASDSCKTWSRFESTKKDGTNVKLRIQDLPMGMKEDAIEFVLNYYVREEAYQVAAGILKSEMAIKEYRELLTGFLIDPKTHSVVCCLDEPSCGKIIGLSFMQTAKNTDKVNDLLQGMSIKSEEIRNLFHIFTVLEDYSGQMPHEKYYQGCGMAVHPEYRGLGLSNEFIRLRKVISADHKIPMTCAWMTALATQKAADKYNWKTFSEISPEELGKMTGLSFEKKLSTFKLMYTTSD